jgi:hypothetical protein
MIFDGIVAHEVERDEVDGFMMIVLQKTDRTGHEEKISGQESLSAFLMQKCKSNVVGDWKEE